jgi:hypothetical protein
MAVRSPGTPIHKEVPPLPESRWLASGTLKNPAPEFARHQPVGALALAREDARRRAGEQRADRLWTAGDALIGSSTVVKAMAQGKEAARVILEFRPHRPGRKTRRASLLDGALWGPPGTAAPEEVSDS